MLLYNLDLEKQSQKRIIHSAKIVSTKKTEEIKISLSRNKKSF